MVYNWYLKQNVGIQSFVDGNLDVAFDLKIIDRIDYWFVRLGGCHEGDEDAAVGGHKHKTGQAPSVS